MTAPHIVDLAGVLDQALGRASPDLMRILLQTMVNVLLSADADAVCGAEDGRAGPELPAQRTGYRHWNPGARVGAIDVTVPKLRTGSYFPNWLLERRKLAESVLIAVVADAHLVGVSTRRMDKLVGTLGISSKLVNALVSTIFAQTSRKAIMTQYERVINALRDDFPEIAQMLADAQPGLTAFAAFPRERWIKIRSFQPHRAPQPRDQAPRRRRPGSSPIATPYTPPDRLRSVRATSGSTATPLSLPGLTAPSDRHMLQADNSSGGTGGRAALPATITT